jgi:ferritin-like metal-binding protein YciE
LSGENTSKLKTVLGRLKTVSQPKKNKIVTELINQTNHMASENAEAEVRDAGFIAGHQLMSHYKIANYGTAAAHAQTLEEKEIASLLHESLIEEKKMDEMLSKIAKEKVNARARKFIAL